MSEEKFNVIDCFDDNIPIFNVKFLNFIYWVIVIYF